MAVGGRTTNGLPGQYFGPLGIAGCGLMLVVLPVIAIDRRHSDDGRPYVRIPIESDHPFRSNPIADSGVPIT
jgi:hypothetical protein